MLMRSWKSIYHPNCRISIKFWHHIIQLNSKTKAWKQSWTQLFSHMHMISTTYAAQNAQRDMLIRIWIPWIMQFQKSFSYWKLESMFSFNVRSQINCNRAIEETPPNNSRYSFTSLELVSVGDRLGWNLTDP